MPRSVGNTSAQQQFNQDASAAASPVVGRDAFFPTDITSAAFYRAFWLQHQPASTSSSVHSEESTEPQTMDIGGHALTSFPPHGAFGTALPQTVTAAAVAVTATVEAAQATATSDTLKLNVNFGTITNPITNPDTKSFINSYGYIEGGIDFGHSDFPTAVRNAKRRLLLIETKFDDAGYLQLNGETALRIGPVSEGSAGTRHTYYICNTDVMEVKATVLNSARTTTDATHSFNLRVYVMAVFNDD
jgi:hypothetical protein